MASGKKITVFIILVFAFSFFLFTFGSINNASALSCKFNADCGGDSQFAHCLDGSCSCLYSFLNCDNNWKNGCETKTVADVNNCGACGKKCGSNQSCKSGVCVNNPVTPISSCIGVTCGPNSSCSLGNCYCSPGYKSCDNLTANGCESAINVDPNNCGSCGAKCAAGYGCVSGSCVKGGGGEFALCNFVKCGVDSYCFDGQCMCKAGTKNCDGDWQNGCECGGLYAGCSGSQCGCQAGFNDCDGNPLNGCETGGSCPPCKVNEVRTCNTTSVCDGRQICSRDGYWGECLRITAQICTPFSSSSCVPTIDGKKCPAIGGVVKCNSCGSKYGACTPTAEAVCCPDIKTTCEIGQCVGVKSCAEDGKAWGSCVSEDGTLCCSQDTDCNDFNGCTTEKCTNNKCEYSPVEDCRGIMPVKCKTDNNCASKDSCVDGYCLPLQCNAEFIIENHKCVCTGKECGGACHFSQGTCCGGHWNDDFDSCVFDFRYYEERINLSLNQEAAKLLEEAKNISYSGDLRKASVMAKIAIAIAEIRLSAESENLKNQSLAFVNEAKTLLASGNYSASLDKVDEALDLLDGGVAQVKEVEPSLWEKNKIPIIFFSSIIVILFTFIIYIIIVPKI